MKWRFIGAVLLLVCMSGLFAVAQNMQINYDINTPNLQLENTRDDVLPMAYGKWKFFGNIYSSAQLPGFTQYWNQVTPENAGKWGSVERVRDQMNWNDLDNAYKLAKDNGFPFRFHVLVWGNQQPGWIESLSSAEQLLEIEEWFRAVAERYPEIDYLEVVNEFVNDPPSGAGNGNYINALGGTGTSGYDWIITAFRMAREIFPETTQLMLNEYGVISNPGLVSTYVKVANLLKEEDLIDVIGFQAHAFSTRGSAASMKVNLNNLAKAGLPIMVTEMDVDGASDEIQLNDYQKIFPVFWEHTSVIGVTLWGYRPGLWRQAEKAYLINSDGSERPAMVWLREYVESSLVSADQLKSEPDFVVYPNPVTDGFIRITGIEHAESISLYQMNGKLVKTRSLYGENQVSFEMDVLPGIYLLSLREGNRMYHRKVVVK